MRKIEIKLYSEYRHHGSHGPKPRKQKSAASRKARAILGTIQQPADETQSHSGPEAEEPKKTHEPKGYGQHSGNKHVETLLTRELTEENAQSILVYLDNLTSRFEAMTSWDVHQAKHKYNLQKQDIYERYLQTYGEVTSDKVATDITIEKSKCAFDYTQHQISIIIISDEPFDGSRPSEDGLHRRELRTKRIYSQGRKLLSAEARKRLKDCSKENTELTTTTLLPKGGRFIRNPRTNRLEFQIDFGQLADRIFEMDSYD